MSAAATPVSVSSATTASVRLTRDRPCARMLPARWNFRAGPGSKVGIVELSVKHARVASWADVGGREAALVQRCAAGDEAACAELVGEHQRMVVQLAVNLLGDRDE